MPKRKKDKKHPPEYQELLDGIRKIIAEAAADGIDLFRREELLTCQACGAHEDMPLSGIHEIRDRKKNVLGHGQFILIDTTERSYRRNQIVYFKTTHEFICSICGAQQSEVFREQYEDID